MTRDERRTITEDIILLLRKDCNREDSLAILAICLNFILHKIPAETRRDEFERFVHQLYEAEFSLERYMKDRPQRPWKETE